MIDVLNTAMRGSTQSEARDGEDRDAAIEERGEAIARMLSGTADLNELPGGVQRAGAPRGSRSREARHGANSPRSRPPRAKLRRP